MGEAPISQGLNHYSYVQNNPVSYTDPTGLVLCETRPGEAECVRIPGPGPYGPGQECGVFRDACTILGPEDLAEAVALVRAHHLDIYDFLPNHVCASDNGCVSSMKGNPAPEKPTKGDPKTGSKGPAKDSAQQSKAAPKQAATGTSTVAANGGPDVVSEITITGSLDAFGQIDVVSARMDDIAMGLSPLMDQPKRMSDEKGEGRAYAAAPVNSQQKNFHPCSQTILDFSNAVITSGTMGQDISLAVMGSGAVIAGVGAVGGVAGAAPGAGIMATGATMDLASTGLRGLGALGVYTMTGDLRPLIDAGAGYFAGRYAGDTVGFMTGLIVGLTPGPHTQTSCR